MDSDGSSSTSALDFFAYGLLSSAEVDSDSTTFSRSSSGFDQQTVLRRLRSLGFSVATLEGGSNDFVVKVSDSSDRTSQTLLETCQQAELARDTWPYAADGLVVTSLCNSIVIS